MQIKTKSEPVSVWPLYAAAALVLIGGAWQARTADRLGREVERLRIQVNGLPQVVERQMDCGCTRCACCQCRQRRVAE
jgi:hypothetical protein